METKTQNISEYIHNLCKELEIEGTMGLRGNEMELIALVRNCPLLYDKKLADFKDLEKKQIAWQAIASIFNVSHDILKQFWRTLRESFVKHLDKTDQRAKRSPPYFEEMNFLLPFIHKHTKRDGPANTPIYDKEDSNTSASSEPDAIGTEFEFRLDVLVDKVYEHPILYDRRHKDAKNHELKLKTWKIVSRDLGIPVSECVGKWKILREKFSKERKYRKLHPNEKKWDLYEKLSFLNDHVLTRRRYSHPQITSKTSNNSIQTDTVEAVNCCTNSTPSSIINTHQYDTFESENCGPYNDVKYIMVEGCDSDHSESRINETENISIPLRSDDCHQDEDELFGLTVAAELRKITNAKKKMKLKSEIYKVLSFEHQLPSS